MRNPLLITLALCVLPVTGPAAGEPAKPQGDTARISYSLGYQIGGDFKRQRVAMDAEVVVQGIQDALSGAEPRMTAQEMNATLVALKRSIVDADKAELRAMAAQKATADKQFLEENKNRPGVKALESGLQYRIIDEGTGRSPTATDEVLVNYRGTLINGQEFDSSHEGGEPARFRLNGVIKGWTQGLQLIKEGGKIELFVPPQLGYGTRGPLANRTLLFEVELIGVAAPESARAAASEKVAEAH